MNWAPQDKDDFDEKTDESDKNDADTASTADLLDDDDLLYNVTIPALSNAAAAAHCRPGRPACPVPLTHALGWRASQAAQYLLLAPKAAGNVAAIGYCMTRDVVSISDVLFIIDIGLISKLVSYLTKAP